MSNARKRARSKLPVVKRKNPTNSAQNSVEHLVNILPGSASIPARVAQVIEQSSFSGPIPHPEVFRQYGEVLPDAPERILRVFEEDSKHVREITMAALNAQRTDNQRAHWMAWSLIFSGLFLTGFLAYIDKQWLASVVAGTTLAGTIASFLGGKRGSKPTEKHTP